MAASRQNSKMQWISTGLIDSESRRSLEYFAMSCGQIQSITIAVFRRECGCRIRLEVARTILGKLSSFVAVNNFLKKNGLLSLIRAHEAQFEGFKAYVWQNTDFPQVVTLFSAPNYCGSYANKGAIIKLIVG